MLPLQIVCTTDHFEHDTKQNNYNIIQHENIYKHKANTKLYQNLHHNDTKFA